MADGIFSSPASKVFTFRSKVANTKMASPLMNLPTEIRIKIIEFVAVNRQKRLQLPCCEAYAKDGFSNHASNWHEAADATSAVPEGARNVLALARVNEQLHNEVAATFFSKAIAHFCQTDVNECGISSIQGLGKVFSPYKASAKDNVKLKDALENFQTIHYQMSVGQDMIIKDNDKDAHFHLRNHLACKFALMDAQRFFVEAMNASRSVTTVKICCTFVGKVDKTTNIEDAFRAFVQLRNDIRLDIHVHVVDLEDKTELTLPYNGFPSFRHYEHLDMLRKSRAGPADTPCLINEWIHVLCWMFSSLPSLQHCDCTGGMDGDLTDKMGTMYMAADERYESPLRQLITAIWRAHDAGDRLALDVAKDHLLESWKYMCKARGECLREDFEQATEGIEVLDLHEDGVGN